MEDNEVADIPANCGARDTMMRNILKGGAIGMYRTYITYHVTIRQSGHMVVLSYWGKRNEWDVYHIPFDHQACRPYGSPEVLGQ
ncbi:hypothetical protein HOLleu_39908 [Holothuria leucospilota]|uniref:Uncharacterized protein n=1 Tax=Holothuria leucospilota TaxID=206669 RepID=A0A9Q0YCW9_HOLLE|nr:hypothetical protein HOLleu_39908 [Holothuria leucospilota]